MIVLGSEPRIGVVRQILTFMFLTQFRQKLVAGPIACKTDKRFLVGVALACDMFLADCFKYAG